MIFEKLVNYFFDKKGIEIVSPAVKEVKQDFEDPEGAYKQIETCARICYASETNPEKAKDFVERIVLTRGHTSPAAHGALYLTEQLEKTSNGRYKSQHRVFEWFDKNPYSMVRIVDIGSGNSVAFISSNYRVYFENKNVLDAINVLDYATEPTKYHEKRNTVILDGAQIGVSREYNRHTTIIPSEQSTRYVNFSLDKNGGNIRFSRPWWVSDYGPEHNIDKSRYYSEQTVRKAAIILKFVMLVTNWAYRKLLDVGMRAEDARYVIPLGAATKVAYSGYKKDWKHFFDMRTARAAHPDARVTAIDIQNEFAKNE